MKNPQEDEPPKARRGWQRGRARPGQARPEQNGDHSPPAAPRKRSSRSVFGPSGEDRPDVLTDAETVVLPVWLHHRPGSAEKKTPESTAAFLKSITLPGHLGKAPTTRQGTGKPPARDAEAEPEEARETGAGSGGERAGTAAGQAAGESGEIQPADTGQDEADQAEPAEAAEAQSESEAEAQSESEAGADAVTVIGPLPTGTADPDPDAVTMVGPFPTGTAAPGAQAGAEAQTDADTKAGDEAESETAAAKVAAVGTAAGVSGPEAATLPAANRPSAETLTRFSLADFKTAIEAKADQATADQATTIETTTVPAQADEALQAIDVLEARTMDGLEARTAEAIETIEAMTAEALEAIDATVSEIDSPVTGETAPSATDTTQPATAKTSRTSPTATTQLDRTGSAASSPDSEATQSYMISIDEPPVSVTLTTSATETTIALPQPRSESVVSVTPAPAAADTAVLTPVPQRPHSGKPVALPPAPRWPGEQPEAEPGHQTTRRRIRVSRLLLLCVLILQAVLSLRLRNTAFEDEALYVYSGHMELQHLLHGSALQGQYAAYFSGSPVLYPVAAGFLNGIGGLTAARMLSLAEMLSITVLLYALSRRLFNERIALCAAVLFSVCESAIFLGNFATYDATCLFLLACAAWIVVRTAAFRWPVFLMAAPVAALAVGVKYAGLLFVPTIAVLPAVAGWPLRGRWVLLYPPAFVATVGALLYGALKLGGKAYMTAISSTTTNRVQGATPVSTLLKESAEWGGVIFVLALIGTAVYVYRVRTEPEELIAPAGGRFRRLCLGVLLTGTALLAPAYQAHLHTDISFQKHIGFGLFFAAPMAGVGLARLLGDHLRRPHIAVGIWSLALVLGLVQTTHLYQVWPNSTQFVRAFSQYLKPKAKYLVEVPEVPIYYLLGHQDAQPSQFTSTFYINYVNKKQVVLSGTVGFTAAVDAGYFHVVAYNNEVTAAADAVLAEALSASKDYYLAAEVNITDVFGPGDYFIWVKGTRPGPRRVFKHASRKYPDLGTKLTEVAP